MDMLDFDLEVGELISEEDVDIVDEIFVGYLNYGDVFNEGFC